MSRPGSSAAAAADASAGGRGVARSGAHHSRVASGGSSSSFRSSSSSRRRSSINTIEASVTRLLVATKQLLESLTQWARGEVSEQYVSDVYVRLGNEFNISCRAFYRLGIDVGDLGDVPTDLRVILEQALSEDQSQQSLDRFLPAIRNIIVNLLHGLKEKQARLRKIIASQSELPALATAGPAPAQENSPIRRNATVSSPTRQARPLPPRSSSFNASPTRGRPDEPVPPPHQPADLPAPVPPQHASLPPPASPQRAASMLKRNPSVTLSRAGSRKDPLTALQHGEALERRASRRLSAYQSARSSLGRPFGMGSITPSSSTVAPPGTSLASMAPAGSPKSRPKADVILEDQSAETDDDRSYDSSDYTPNELATTAETISPDTTAASEAPVTAAGLAADLAADSAAGSAAGSAASSPASSPGAAVKRAATVRAPPGHPAPLTLFLQLGRHVKKVEAAPPLSLPALRLLFIEKFAYSPGPESFPEIYVADARTGVRYELDEANLDDVRPDSIVSLDIEVLDEVKKHFDDGLAALTANVAALHDVVAQQSETVAKVAAAQAQASARLDELVANIETAVAKSAEMVVERSAAASPLSPTASAASSASVSPKTGSPAPPRPKASQYLAEIAKLRTDLAVLRQMHTSFVKDIDTSFGEIKATSASLGRQPAAKAPPRVGGDEHIAACHERLAADSDSLLNRVDDLQDVVEALRKDVATRGVRPLPKDLQSISKELAVARTELHRMEDYLKVEKPVCKKIWEQQLDDVCEEQQFFKLQEDLVADLRDDLEKTLETFSLVEQFTAQQMKAPPRGGNGPVGGFGHAQDTAAGKDAVLREVKALQPNHEQRVEAIERAEKLRKIANDSRKVDDFERELGEFVGEGRLKKSGGIEEIERQRKQRQQEAWREQFGVIGEADEDSDDDDSADDSDSDGLDDDSDDLGDDSDAEPAPEAETRGRGGGAGGAGGGADRGRDRGGRRGGERGQQSGVGCG
ncbi:actin interacting protein 3-domain-containing protein [Dipodascopsis tothii]|uniref:actin interacting protein 3-domain-containing protein n=1 Tax=Dipodascopsis tothii TaxID=44089 RepID=UPI0034CF6E2D